MTIQSLKNLPKKADLNVELNQLFESVTIHVGEELVKRDEIFNAELKKRDDRIDRLEKKLEEFQSRNINSRATPNPPLQNYVPEIFPSNNKDKEDIDICLIGDSLTKHSI